MTDKKSTKFDFESSMVKLESIVNRIEQGKEDLEESLKLFSEGVELTKKCQDVIKSAEQKVNILVEGKLKDFTLEDENNE